MDIEAKIRNHEYTSKMSYDPKNVESRKAYKEDCMRLNALFEADAIKDCGLEGHPKAERAFEMAWERGHSSGLYEVLCELQELADLLIG